MIRVLELLVSTGFGGGPRQVWELARRLPRDEFELVVAGPRGGPFVERFRAFGTPVEELAADRLGPGAFAAALRLIRRHRVDLVHTHGKGAGLYGRLAARRAAVPAVHTHHGIHYAHYPPGVRALYLALERRLARLTHTVINVSPSQEAEGLALGLFERGQSAVVVNGVDLDALDRLLATAALSRPSLGLGDGDFVLGTVARFDPIKRLDVLVHAFGLVAGRLERARLVLVGGGPEEGRLRRLVTSARLGARVSFTGFLEDPARVCPALDLYAATSAKEGLPLAVVEAMAARLPVVVTGVPGHRDVVRHDATGLLVPPGDARAFAEAVLALAGDSGRRRRLGEAGRARAADEFGIEPMVQRTAEIYRRAVLAR